MIKYQAERIYLTAVEIGKRLTEAMALLKYVEWGKWLEESVDFSQSRANKLMRIFKEYGSEQLTSSDSDSNPNLNYNRGMPGGSAGPPGQLSGQVIQLEPIALVGGKVLISLLLEIFKSTQN